MMHKFRRRQTMPQSDDESDSDSDISILSVAPPQKTTVGIVRLDGKPEGAVKQTGLDKLWSEALQLLNDKDRVRIVKEGQITGQNNTFRMLVDGINRQQNAVAESRLSYTKKNGEKVLVRDKMEKVVTWFTKSQLFEFGNILSEVSIYAALPWACISTVFTVAAHHMEADRSVMEGVEDVSNMIARYTHYHNTYLDGDDDYDDTMKERLEEAIVKTFSAVLVFLAQVIRFYKGSEKRRKKILAPFKATSISTMVGDCLRTVVMEDENVTKLLGLMDTDYQRKTRSFMDVNFAEMRSVIISIQNQIDDFKAMLKGDDSKLQDIVEQIMNAISPKVENIETLKTWLGGWVVEDSFRDANDIRMDNTCKWLLERDEYVQWKTQSADTKLLWIYGPPGSGKSVLCSTAIKELMEDKRNVHKVAYFFCSARFENTRDPDSIARSWVQQLLHDEFAHRVASEYYSKQKTGSRASMHDVWDLYHQIAQKMQDCICVLDGLDECFKISAMTAHKATPNRWLDFLMKLEKYSKGTKVRLLLVSRDEADIRQNLMNWKAHGVGPVHVTELEIKSEYTRSDIELFAYKSVEEAVIYSDPAVSGETLARLSSLAAEKSKGMFLYITLLKTRIEQYIANGRTEQSLFEAIDELGDYDEAYGRILDMIQSYKGERRIRAEAVLRWVLFAARPLQMQELAEALEAAMYSSSNSPNSNARGSLIPANKLTTGYFQQIISLCGSFVIWSEKASTAAAVKTVDFVHFTAKEFLLSDSETPSKDAFHFEDEAHHQAMLAEICLRYLCCDDFKKPSLKINKTYLDQIRSEFRFLEYAASFVFQHIQNAGSAAEQRSGLQPLLNKFFGNHTDNWYLWAYLFERTSISDSAAPIDTIDYKTFKPGTKMYYCAYFGLVETMKYLYSLGMSGDLNGYSGKHGTPLQAAIVNKHNEAANLLLEWGSDPNVAALSDNALHAAVRTSASNTVQLLLQHGAKIDDDLLLQALRGNDLEIFHQLWTQIEKSGSDIKNKEALLHQVASEAGVESFIKLLLKSGTSITWKAKGHFTALHRAATAGRLENARLIIKEAQRRLCIREVLEARDHVGRTPFWAAAAGGSVEVCALLLKNGASEFRRTNNKRSPMHAAALSGHPQMILYLHSMGHHVDDSDDQWHTPLQLAVQQCKIEAARTLLGIGAGVNAKNKEGWSSLAQAAHVSDDVEMVRLLLDHGASIDSFNKDDISIINTALIAGNKAIVKELMDRGADLRQTNRNGQTAAHQCARFGRPEMIKWVLDWGLEADAEDTLIGRTPLYLAVEEGRPMMVKVLLSRGANVHKTTKEGSWTPLHESIKKGYLDITEMLLAAGADPNAANEDGITCFHSIWRTGSVSLASLLLSHGADVNLKRKDQFTALHYAAFEGRLEWAEFLIEHGANLEDQTREGYTPLHLCMLRNHWAIAELLIRRGADVNHRDYKSWTPLHRAAHLGHLNIVEMLVAKPEIDLEARNDAYTTAINDACKQNRADVIRVLAKAGANLEKTSNDSPWPLIIESIFQDVKCLEALLAGGASIWVKDRCNSVCLHAAAYNGKKDHLELILQHLEVKCPDSKSEYLDLRNSWNRTALIDACVRGHVECVEALMRHGVDVNARGLHKNIRPITIALEHGHHEVARKLLESPQIKLDEALQYPTALHLTTIKRFPETFKALIAKDRNKVMLNHPGWQGSTPLIEAAIHGRPFMTRWLIDAGADVHKTCNLGMTPLHHASQRDQVNIIEALLEHGADLEALDDQGRTPLAVAIDQEQKNAVRFLLQAGARLDVVGRGREWLAKDKGLFE